MNRYLNLIKPLCILLSFFWSVAESTGLIVMSAETVNEPLSLPWVSLESLNKELLFLKRNLQNVVLNNRYQKEKIEKIKGINEDLQEKLVMVRWCLQRTKKFCFESACNS